MHPSQLSDLLIRKFPAIEQLPPQLRHAYATMILRLSAQSCKKHKRASQFGFPDEAQTIHCRKLEEWFGRRRFKAINKLCHCINHSSCWNMDSGVTKAYWLTNTGHYLIEEARQLAMAGEQNLLLDHNGSSIRKKPNGIYTARDSQGNNAVTNAFIEWAIPVNIEMINHVLDIGLNKIFPDVDSGRLARTDCSLRAIHACALNNNVGQGLIPQVYREAPSGRLYGFGSLSLQNVTRETKIVALHDAHEYDFINCHYQLLGNISVANGIHTPLISEYLHDPKAFRQELAHNLGITYKQVKKCLLALLYGATTNSVWHENAIPKEIGPEKALELYCMPQFNKLSFEILEVGDRMIEFAKRTRSGAIVNCRGKACQGNFKQELAHLLQGMEAELLHLMLAEYGSDMLIIQHDGFAMSHYVDPVEMEATILYLAEYEMPMTHDKLTLP